MKKIATLKTLTEAKRMVRFLTSVFHGSGAVFSWYPGKSLDGLIENSVYDVYVDVDSVPDALQDSMNTNARFVAIGFVGGVEA